MKMKKISTIICLLFLMNTQAQSSFEYLFPAPESGSEYGRYCVQHKEKFIVSTEWSSFQIYGGAIPFESYAIGTNIWILDNNGIIESENLYSTAGDFNWGIQSEFYITDEEQILLPFNKRHLYTICDTTLLIIETGQYERGIFSISENNEEIENTSLSPACDNLELKFTNYENSIFTSVYKNNENENYLEQRDEELNIIQETYLGTSYSEWNNVFKTTSGYYTITKSGYNFIIKKYDSNFNFMSDQNIELMSGDDATTYNIGYLSVNENEYLYYYQYIESIPHSYIISFNSSGVLFGIENPNIKISDITTHQEKLLSLSNIPNENCNDNSKKMKVDLLDENLDIITTGYYGLDYVTGHDISLSNDNHFVIVGTAQKPSQCYEEDEISGRQAYILKSSLTTLNLTENNRNPIRISPNPSTNILNIKHSSNIDEIVINDVSGKEIERHHTAKNTINISHLNKGIYLIGIKSEESWYWDKFVKQ